MHRIAAFAAAVLVAVGCGPAPAPLTDVTVYWEFERNTFVDGVDGFLPYDTLVNWPPGTTRTSCPESGVDFVTVTDLNGTLLVPSVLCINQLVQGVVLAGFPGNNTYVVTGWRNNVELPLYRGQVTVNVGSGSPPYFGTAIAVGIPNLLTVDAVLVDAAAPQGYPTCGAAGIQRFDAWLEDGFGNVVWQAAGPTFGVPCALNELPGVSFGLVDRDQVTLWMDAVDTRGTSSAVIWSRCGFGFPHIRGQEDRFSLPLPLGMCDNPPPP